MGSVVVALVVLLVSCDEIVDSHVDDVAVYCVYEVVVLFDRKSTCCYHLVLFKIALLLIRILLSFQNRLRLLLFMLSFFRLLKPRHRRGHYTCVCRICRFVGYDDFLSPTYAFLVFCMLLFWNIFDCL